jgi:hypothetical protein
MRLSWYVLLIVRITRGMNDVKPMKNGGKSVGNNQLNAALLKN